MKLQKLSLQNSKIKKYLKLKQKKYREKEGLFIIEGEHLVQEAQKSNLVVEILTSNKNKKGILVSNETIKKFASTQTPQDVIAICKKVVHNIIGNKLLALDNIQDPGNLGTLIRTAKAFGWNGIILKGVDPYNPKVIRSSQGAFFTMPIFRTNDITDFFNNNYEVVGAVLNHQAINYQNYKKSQKIILVLGNEGNGISENVLKKLHKQIYIPVDFESLNVAQAGAILLNEYQ